ncbi:MAG TPA: dephospho-CoA kinase [Tenuifilaceae bacterium]|nr:dephospho-CoA kinase [Tenuifilaceae bacterium]HRX30968.1 dephospho-CoA kinase [Tenuifilaceae bacterium]
MMLKVGITGGIGSGKTYICKIIEQLGYPVYNADVRAKELTNSNSNIKSAVKSLFGKDIYVNGKLNRSAVAKLVFEDSTLLEKLNRIIHPEVQNDFETWANSNFDNSIVFKEAAILFESGMYKLMDANILVTAPLNIRIGRVMERDGVSKNDVLKRINNQFSDEEKLKLANYTIVNDGKVLVLPQIINVINELTK